MKSPNCIDNIPIVTVEMWSNFIADLKEKRPENTSFKMVDDKTIRVECVEGVYFIVTNPDGKGWQKQLKNPKNVDQKTIRAQCGIFG